MNRQKALKLMKITKDTYNLIGEEFSDTRDKVWPEMEVLVKKYVKQGDKVLDVGCGNARLLDILPQVDYWGIDTSAAMLRNSKFKIQNSKLNKKIVNFKELDILELGKLKERRFDIIFMFASFNHVASEDLRLKILEDVRKLLKLGGLLIMTNWNMWQWGAKKSIWKSKRIGFKDVMTIWKSRDGKKSGKLYYRAFTKGELKKLIEKTGFKIIENYYSLNGKRVGWWQGRNIVTVIRC